VRYGDITDAGSSSSEQALVSALDEDATQSREYLLRRARRKAKKNRATTDRKIKQIRLRRLALRGRLDVRHFSGRSLWIYCENVAGHWQLIIHRDEKRKALVIRFKEEPSGHSTHGTRG